MPKIHPTITKLQKEFLKNPEKIVPDTMLRGLSQSEIIRRALDNFILKEKKRYENNNKKNAET